MKCAGNHIVEISKIPIYTAKSNRTGYREQYDVAVVQNRIDINIVESCRVIMMRFFQTFSPCPSMRTIIV